jgi:hypothetical protein
MNQKVDRRRISTYVMLLGLLVAAGILGTRGVRAWRANHRLEELQAQCRAGASQSSFVPEDCTSYTSCDPYDLSLCRSGLIGVRLAIHREYQAVKAWQDIKPWVAIIAVLASIPRTWYFLLARIAELSEAVRGN